MSPRIAHNHSKTLVKSKASVSRSPKIMCDYGWRAKVANKYKTIKNSNNPFSVASNLLELNFGAAAPDFKWVPDVTAIWTDYSNAGL
jgi:hypothetical protein